MTTCIHTVSIQNLKTTWFGGDSSLSLFFFFLVLPKMTDFGISADTQTLTKTNFGGGGGWGRSLCWVLCCTCVFSRSSEQGATFIAVYGLLIAVVSLAAVLRFQSTGSVLVAHGLSCSETCRIFLDQGLDHVSCFGRQISIYLPHHQRSPKTNCFECYGFLISSDLQHYLPTAYIAPLHELEKGFFSSPLVAQTERSCLQIGRLRFDSCVRKYSWRRSDNPLQYSCLVNATDRGAWRAILPWGLKELDTTERLTLSLSSPLYISRQMQTTLAAWLGEQNAAGYQLPTPGPPLAPRGHLLGRTQCEQLYQQPWCRVLQRTENTS